jgi:hypothetical protein
MVRFPRFLLAKWQSGIVHIHPSLRRVIRQQGSQHGLAWQPAHFPAHTGLSPAAFESSCAVGCGVRRSSMQEVRTSQRNAGKGKGDGPAPPEQQATAQATYFPQASQGSAQQLANFWAQANGQVRRTPRYPSHDRLPRSDAVASCRARCSAGQMSSKGLCVALEVHRGGIIVSKKHLCQRKVGNGLRSH